VEELEVIVNLWYFVDAETGYTYGLAGRAYAAVGTEKHKFDLLRQLAATDYMMAKQFPVPKNFQLVSPEGELKGITGASEYELRHSNLFEEVFRALEKEIPERIEWIKGERVVKSLTVPQQPLCLFTPLIEDEGGMHPRITRHPKTDVF
jgi:hypothetical protein